MIHKLINLKFLRGTSLELTFQNGEVVIYDMSKLMGKYPELIALKDRKLFISGKMFSYGIRWNDRIDIGAEALYQEGEHIRSKRIIVHPEIAEVVSSARAEADITQSKLAELSGIDQSDISKIERGLANPSIATLKSIAKALDKELKIIFE